METAINRRKRSRSMRDNPLLRSFQDRLEALRRERGLSRKVFADHLGMPHSSYATLLAQNANPTLGTIVWIAGRVGLDPQGMFGGGEPCPSDRQGIAGQDRPGPDTL